jgi:hypothetical protein
MVTRDAGVAVTGCLFKPGRIDRVHRQQGVGAREDGDVRIAVFGALIKFYPLLLYSIKPDKRSQIPSSSNFRQKNRDENM